MEYGKALLLHRRGSAAPREETLPRSEVTHLLPRPLAIPFGKETG